MFEALVQLVGFYYKVKQSNFISEVRACFQEFEILRLRANGSGCS